MSASSHTLSALRRSLVDLERSFRAREAEAFNPGLPGPGTSMVRGALHEVHATSTGNAPSSISFAAALAIQAAGARPLVWIRQDRPHHLAGRLYPPGLAELGLDPAQLILVCARDATGVLRAALEAARCSTVGAVLIELWGAARVLDLTATRRLSLAAAQSGVTVLLACIAARPGNSAASTRWEIRAAPSMPLEANAPGLPSFNVALQRHRSLPGRDWQVEWDRDRHIFRTIAPLSRDVPALPADRTPLVTTWPIPGEEGELRRAG